MSHATLAPVVLESALIDIRALAAALGRSVPTLERDDAAGRVPRHIKIGRSKRWRRAEISEWIELGCPCRADWEAMKKQTKRGA